MLNKQNISSDGATLSVLRGLDQLAVEAMVRGFDHSMIADLKTLGEHARGNGAAVFASRAEFLESELQQLNGRAAEEMLNQGLAELRTLIHPEMRDESAAVMQAYANLGDDAELVADFLVEAREHLSLVEAKLLSLESDPNQIETVHAVFRAFHTIKGLAGFLDFPIIQAVSHEVETLLDLARNAELVIDSPMVDAVLESTDFLTNEMASIDLVLAGAASAPSADHRSLVHKIRALASPADESSQKPAMQSGETTPEAALVTTYEAAVDASKPASQAAESDTDNLFQRAGGVEDLAGIQSAALGTAHVVETVPVKILEPARVVEPARPSESGSVRVETAKLDHLMDMVGEMVIAQSQIRHSQVLLHATDSRLVGDLSHLARVTAEVQRATMSMRMVPVAQLFQKIERVIRDLSRKAGKQVVLVTSGVDTDVDKTVAEELSDPLLHMVRNSVDHGIETAEERIAAGKSAIATINLSAYHRGGQIVIEIADDGRGLNVDKIRGKAEQKKIIAAGAQLTDAETYQLIFAPGFSTAEVITDVSGRGVGMDVVRRNVEKLRGRIETQSVAGHGTTFSLKLPLTLAIIDGLVVEVGASQYIVPLSVVREICRPLPSTLFSVEGRQEMVLVRDHLLPVVRLSDRLGVRSRIQNPSEGLLVLIESENKLYCLLVDDLLGKQEVVIKSLGETFKDAFGFSGCAVLGNGRVGLILDTDGIYRGKRR